MVLRRERGKGGVVWVREHGTLHAMSKAGNHRVG